MSKSRAFRRITFLAADEWFQGRNEWDRLLGVSQERITPGAELGLPKAEADRLNTDDRVNLSARKRATRRKK